MNNTPPEAMMAVTQARSLPCPFCGARPHHGLEKVQYDQLHGDPFQHFSIWCPKGHAKVTAVNEERANEQWNTRLAPHGAEVGKVKRVAPKLLDEAEAKALLTRAEELWADLQKNNLGGFSGINRPFYIVAEFKRVIEEFGYRDVGLNWSNDQLAALSRPPVMAGDVEVRARELWDALCLGRASRDGTWLQIGRTAFLETVSNALNQRESVEEEVFERLHEMRAEIFSALRSGNVDEGTFASVAAITWATIRALSGKGEIGRG